MNISNEYREFESRMLMQASSCAYKLLRSKKTGTGDGKLFSFIRKYDSPYHFRFSSRIHKLEPCVNGVYIIYHGDRLTKAHRTFNVWHSITSYIFLCVPSKLVSWKTFITNTMSPGRLMYGVHKCPTGYEFAYLAYVSELRG